LFHRKGRKKRKGFCYLNFASFAVHYFYSSAVCFNYKNYISGWPFISPHSILFYYVLGLHVFIPNTEYNKQNPIKPVTSSNNPTITTI
jgi:hypothetical protein